jgi:16S rRNA (cytidine1402-2'-O)-methyltransferase
MCTNHIGNSHDLSTRIAEILKVADVLVFEEDKQARQALKHAGIHRPYLKFSEHGEQATLEQVKKALKSKQTVAYMSDQGCPSLADPGGSLLSLAQSVKAKIKVIPGPSALTAAIAAYPLPLNQFHYAGFLPRQAPARLAELRRLQALNTPLVILDTPYRLQVLLNAISNVYPSSHKALLALDIGNAEENYYFTSIAQLCRMFEEKNQLNFVLIIS